MVDRKLATGLAVGFALGLAAFVVCSKKPAQQRVQSERGATAAEKTKAKAGAAAAAPAEELKAPLKAQLAAAEARRLSAPEEQSVEATEKATVKANLLAVRAKVTQLAAELGCDEPTLVAVSKLKPKHMLMACYEEGQRHFGENYVQEFVDKAATMPGDIDWHFIGHLQSNKADAVVSVPNLCVVESVDSAKLATKLNQACTKRGRSTKLKVLVQVNTTGEASKSGVAPGDAAALVQHIASQCPGLEFVGLMTIGALGMSTEGLEEKCFGALNECKASVEHFAQGSELTLSMGMSGDYPLAMKMCSTNIRVGSTIFGARK